MVVKPSSESPFPVVYFQGLWLLVLGSVTGTYLTIFGRLLISKESGKLHSTDSLTPTTKKGVCIYNVYVGTTPHPVTVTTRIITFLIGNPYKPSFVTVTGWGVDRMYMYIKDMCLCRYIV